MSHNVAPSTIHDPLPAAHLPCSTTEQNVAPRIARHMPHATSPAPQSAPRTPQFPPRPLPNLQNELALPAMSQMSQYVPIANAPAPPM